MKANAALRAVLLEIGSDLPELKRHGNSSCWPMRQSLKSRPAVTSATIAGPDGEIAELLVRHSARRHSGRALAERVEDGRFADILEGHLVEALPVEAAAEIQIVFAGRAAGEPDLGDIGPRAAVRAAAHADGDGLIARDRGLARMTLDLGRPGPAGSARSPPWRGRRSEAPRRRWN